MAIIGLKGLHYATVTTDNATTLAYGAPVAITGAISVSINPNTSSETLFADDGPMETSATLGAIDVEIGVADLPGDVQAALLGHDWDDTSKTLTKKSSDVPPFVALGFKAMKADGTYRYVWLVKGKFQTPEMKNDTKGDKVSYQTATIKGSFVKREKDEVWMIQSDKTDMDDTTWFAAAQLQGA